VAWAKELSYILGNTLYAVATVVAAFMAGLGLGSALAGRYAPRILRPVLAYAGMEWVIAACGIFSIPVFRSTEGIFRLLYNVLEPGHGMFLVVRFLVVFGVMLIPVTLMGMTLPVVVGAYGRRKERYDFEAGILYGVNTLGAVAGTLVAGFLVLPWLGLLKTCVAVGTVDAAVGVVAWWMDKHVGAIEDIRTQGAAQAESVEGKIWTPMQVMIGGVFMVSGAVAMVYEVGWFRLLALVLGPSVHAFSVMLGIFLVGIGLGSVAAAKWAERTKRPLMAMAALEGLIGVAALGTMAFYNELPEWYFHLFRKLAGEGGSGWYVVAQGMVAAVVVLVPTLGMGALFPVVVRAFREASKEGMVPEKNVGRLYVLNTVGGIVGSLAAGFWLVPGMGMWRTVLLASGVSVGLGLIVWLAVREVALGLKAALAVASALVVAGCMWALPEWDTLLLNRGLYREMRNMKQFDKKGKLQGQTMLFYREGVNTTVAILRFPGNISLRVSGKPDASTFALDLYTQLFVGQLPVLFARNPQRVAVIGYGSGMSADAALSHPPVESLDILEIEKGIIEGSKYFEFLNDNPFDDPRTHLVLEDGRIHMTYTDKVYDVIASAPSNPWVAGTANLFTVDFYELVRARLAPDGIFGQWFQLYEVSEDSFKTVVASLHEVFPHVAIFMSKSAEVVVLASSVPIEIPWETLKARFHEEEVYEAFYGLRIRNPFELFHFFFAGTEQVEKYIEGAPALNTDDNVWLEHRMPYDFFGVKTGDLELELLRRFAKERMAGLRELAPGMPEEEAVRTMIHYVHSEEPRRKKKGSEILDYWEKRRTPMVEGFLDVFEEEGNTAMVEKVRAWWKDAEAYRKARLLAVQYILKTLDAHVQQQPSLRRTYIDEALAQAPDLPFALLMAGKFALQEQENAKAEELFRRALERPWSRAYYDAAMGLARAKERQKQLDEALAYVKLAEESNPYFPNAFFFQAYLLDRMGRTDEVSEVLEQGLFYNPDDAMLLNTRKELGFAEE
jgi:spermidine synthase